MDVSNHSTSKNKLVECLLNNDISGFKKYLEEAVVHTENRLVEEYSSRIKGSLNE
jgi:hypothetical protein